MGRKRLLHVVLVGFFVVNATCYSATAKPGAASLITEISETVKKHYQTQQLKPPAALESGLKEMANADLGSSSPAGLRASLSALLFSQFGIKDLVLAQDDQLFRALHDSFALAAAAPPGCRLGIWFQRKGARLFVQDLLIPGSTMGSLKRGDEIITVNGKPFDASAFYAKAEPCPRVKIAFRHQPWDKAEEITVAMIRGDYLSLLLEASLRSKRTINIAGKSLGYLHLWTDLDEQALEALKKTVSEFKTTTQALILDLRGGVGGQGDLLLQLFGKDAPQKNKVYDKPIYLLIDRDTVGSRERLAAYFKESRAATLVGTATSGFAGTLANYFLIGESWLVRLPAALPKEGGAFVINPIPPDVVGDDTLVYAGGYDAILQAALNLAQKG